jgi:hypothetical protein
MNGQIFDPTAGPAARPLALAPRPAQLAGRRLGLVENTKFNADALLLKLAERLGRRHGLAIAPMARKRSPSHQVDDTTIVDLQRRADVVISGIGD